MKARVLLLSISIVVAGAGASLALAAPPAGKGKPVTTGAGCRPLVTVVLRGTLTAVPGVSGSLFSLSVTGTNAIGKAYKSSTVALTIDPKTKVRRNGAKQQGALVVGDRVVVQARACKADLANGAKPLLFAVRIVAHPAKT